MAKDRIVMFAASLGGHFTEMMGLKSLFPKYDSILITDNLNATKDNKDLSAFKEIDYSKAWAIHRQETAGVTDTHSRWQNAVTYFKMFIECFKLYRKYKPAVIVSTGSYIAVPLFISAKLHGTKTIFIESNAKVYSKTMTGILVQHLSDKIYVQWPEMLAIYPKAEYHGVLF